MREQLKAQFQKDPKKVQQIIEDLVASGNAENKMVASDWLYHLWSAGCIKNLEGDVINSYAVWQLGDRVYFCGHCIGRTGGFIMYKVQTLEEYEHDKKTKPPPSKPNRGGDGWWPYTIGATPQPEPLEIIRRPPSPNRYDRVIEQGGHTFFDFMPPFSEKLREHSQARRDAQQRSLARGQPPVLPPSELRVSSSGKRGPAVAGAPRRAQS